MLVIGDDLANTGGARLIGANDVANPTVDIVDVLCSGDICNHRRLLQHDAWRSPCRAGELIAAACGLRPTAAA